MCRTAMPPHAASYSDFMSALPPKATLKCTSCHVCFVPIADIISGQVIPAKNLTLSALVQKGTMHRGTSTDWTPLLVGLIYDENKSTVSV